MPYNKNKREPHVPSSQKTADDRYDGLIAIEGIEPGLGDRGTESVFLNEDSAMPRRDDYLGAEKKFGLRDYFVSKEWHGPYVEAVCGGDEVNGEAIFAEAERAILGRFLELLASAVETDEILDLQSAVYTISLLKKANAVAYTPQHLVA